MKKGLLVVNKPQQGRKGGQNSVEVDDRWEKSHHIETIEVDHGNGRVCRHRVYGIGGAPYEQKVNAAGEPDYVALPGRTLRRKRKTYTDWYRLIDITCTRCCGKQGHAIPLTSQDDTYLRSEHLRQVPVTDEHSKLLRLPPRRQVRQQGRRRSLAP